MNKNSNVSKEAWGSRIGVILAVAGSAVGLGNFLRFPGKAAAYEGGAFMIPYIIALLLLGLPIAYAEWSMGRYGGVRGFNSTPGIFRVIWKNSLSPYIGVLGLIVPVMIYMYYVYIESWCLGYAIGYLTGALNLGNDPDAYKNYFSNYVGMDGNGVLFAGSSPALLFLAACVFMNFLLIYRGLNKGIELFCLYAMPLLVVCAFIVLVRVLTLGTPDPSKPDQNVYNALGYMWNIQSGAGLIKSLSNAQMWLEAAGQIFFSLSVGFGVIITYASYLKERDDIALSSTAAVSGNEFCEVSLGGMITIPAAFLFLGAAGTTAAVAGGTFGLGFQTLPMVFNSMPAGQFFGFLFFFLLFLAAMTSSLSMLQPAIAFLEEGLGLNRKGSVTLLGLVTIFGTGFIVYFSRGMIALDTIDFWIGSFCIFVLATIQVLLFGWVLGTDKGFEEIDRGAEIHIPRLFKFILKYVSPVFLIVIFLAWATQNTQSYIEGIFKETEVQLSILLILVMFLFFLLLIGQAVSRWKKLEAKQGVKA